jgi:MFS family permease
VGARASLIGQSLRDPALGRLNFGVFVLHFILMACFLVVPGFLEGVAGIDRHSHWLVYLPVLLLSIVGMIPLMTLAERGGRPREMFLLGIALMALGVALLGFLPGVTGIYLGLWLFFVGFNYLEATLPSLVSKTVFEGGKGTALGVYSTCQFFGAFAGGAAGGWVLQLAGPVALFSLCLVLALLWWLLALPGTSSAVSTRGQFQDG